MTTARHEAAIDQRRLLELTGDDAEFALELLNLFLETTPALVDRLRAAVESWDAETLHCAAHTIRGSASNVGATRLCDMAQAIELCAVSGDTVGALDALPEFDDAWREVVEECESLS